jgi:threonine synthase
MSALTGLKCPECANQFDADQPQTICNACNSPLVACYDLVRLGREMGRGQISKRGAGIWRWSVLLPVRDPAYQLSMGEGDTPLLPIHKIAADLGLKDVSVKDESPNPTGTFKARGLAVAVSRAVELGLREFVIPTAGNAGGALAVYAARAGLKAHIFMPADAPTVNQHEVLAADGDLHLVDGLIDEAGRQAEIEAQANDWFNVSTFKEPYRVEGKKTMGFELAEDFEWDLPDVIVYPTGGGTGLVGMWKAFEELTTLGWLNGKRPRLVAVQSSGCAPLVRALDEGADRARVWENAVTEAPGLRVPSLFADRLVLNAVRQSRGTGVVVSDDEIRAARDELSSTEGILACPEGAATLAGLRHLVENGWLASDERVVLFNTGSGLKYLT